MTEDTVNWQAPQVSDIGAELRAEREAQGLTLAQVSAETRIPVRHLQSIEEGVFAELPSRTYATGFARTYAKLLGLDTDIVIDRVKREMAAQPQVDERATSFEPGDPARVPTAPLTWLALAAVVLLVLGGFFFMRTLFAPAAELPPIVEQQEGELEADGVRLQANGAAGDVQSTATGPVVFTALEDGVWVKFYDASGRQLMQKQMAQGETYTVPQDAEGPQLWTGRPDALDITIGGQPVPRLADAQRIVRDVPVTASALLARSQSAGRGSAQQPTS